MVKLNLFLLDSILEAMWLFSRKYFPFFEEGAGYLQRESCTSLDLRIPGAVFRAVSLSLRPAQFELVYGAVHSD